MARIGDQQLRLLCTLGNPRWVLVTHNKVSKSLEKRGLVRTENEYGVRITSDGLRALADNIERVDKWIEDAAKSARAKASSLGGENE